MQGCRVAGNKRSKFEVSNTKVIISQKHIVNIAKKSCNPFIFTDAVYQRKFEIISFNFCKVMKSLNMEFTYCCNDSKKLLKKKPELQVMSYNGHVSKVAKCCSQKYDMGGNLSGLY